MRWLTVNLVLIVCLLFAVNAQAQCLDDYDRHDFKHWVDIDGDGLDARQQSIWEQVITAPNGAKIGRIESGKVVDAIIHDPYTGELIYVNDEAPDADHVIPLKAAFDRGANCWDAHKRKQFANDPLNLVAVRAGSNRQKGAKLLFNWIPPRLNYCSEYLARMVLIKDKYQLIPNKDDIAAYQFMTDKCEKFSKGIRVNKVRGWFTKTFGWRQK